MIDNVIKYIVDSGITPSINYGIIKDNKLISNSFGYKELRPNLVKTDINTLYDLASLTKVIVTNTLISLLKEDNLISENDLVIKYLPEFKHKEMTIYNLLTHSSGIKNRIDYKKFNTRQLYIKELMNVDLTLKIGSVHYSDLNYILLGLIIEKICNNSLDVIAKEKIFDKLDMNNTTYKPKDNYASYEETLDRGLVKGFVHDEKAYILGPSGHAGLFSNIKDLSHFCLMVLNDGIYNDKQFLKKETINEWFKGKVFDNEELLNRSNSWIVGKTDICNLTSNNTISHTGFTGTSIIIDRDNDLSIILLSNRIHPSRHNERYKIYRRIINNIITEEL